ncbi:MAG: UDP-glucose/GDP-mannose dehydrogenase family protein [Actinomycetota bacterium]|nr:UDP-glucose/GDP-mannose dehydrogenase family protein [Actinomycetota bacterium]MEC7667275.1 UDP-glucose/GDP-mannose dehydrogenase family protein [Actinomycetota bacterium]MEC8521922.1 UDP-glucose/GDP-mannose dehydrogenase family protein [Actinomycetota bacterium]MEE3068710.1 UDP-glucose/GDP-mannose dehydrogenase family protein [Actinomycetota bacterium]
MSDEPVIGVVGVGYVGLTTGACLSLLGHTVVCGDVDEEKINRLRKGEISIVEKGLAEIVNEGITAGRLEFVVGATEVGERSDIVFLCVPTPEDRDGSADLSFIEAASAEIGPVLREGAIVVNKSTVPVGTTTVIDEVIQRADIKVVSNPEFLREGTAVNDFLHPDRVVVGADDRGAAENVAALYSSIETEIIITDAASAETIKYAANGFLAMKISFVNSVAAMCEAVGADVVDVVEGIGSDRRIGREFLQPGPGWGGSCFPKDSHSLVHLAETHGYGFSMMRSVIAVNDEQRERMVRKVQRAVGTNDLNGMTISVLGLTFKAGTDDLRDSPSLAIIGRLRELGATVRAYDPTTTGRLSRIQDSFLEGINVQQSVDEAMREGDVLVILTEWPEFRSLDFEQVKELLSGSAIVDTRNLLDPQSVRAAGLDYDGVGRKA